MTWACPDCGTGYDRDLSLVCCNPWLDRGVAYDMYEE